MNTPHKYAEIIKAWADGTTIQFRNKCNPIDHWTDCVGQPYFNSDFDEFRIKPETTKYRVGLFNSDDVFAACAVTDKQAKNYENNCLFIRWLTDWVEVEV